MSIMSILSDLSPRHEPLRMPDAEKTLNPAATNKPATAF
jgi:hypothetical protein